MLLEAEGLHVSGPPRGTVKLEQKGSKGDAYNDENPATTFDRMHLPSEMNRE